MYTSYIYMNECLLDLHLEAGHGGSIVEGTTLTVRPVARDTDDTVSDWHLTFELSDVLEVLRRIRKRLERDES